MERIRDYTVLDLEMTGLDVKKNKVIEIGAVRVRGGSPAATLSCLVNPEMEIPDRVVQLTGITNEMAAAGRPADEAMRELLDFLGDDLLVGQNVIFDYGFLAQWCANKRIKIEVKALDTLKIARKILPKDQPKNLEALCQYFAIHRENAHRALDDAEETRQVFEKLQDLILLQNAEQKPDEIQAQNPEQNPEQKPEEEALLTPAVIRFHTKRQTPATPQQLKRLKEYMQLHSIKDEIKWDTITRSEASRLQDRYYAVYGR